MRSVALAFSYLVLALLLGCGPQPAPGSVETSEIISFDGASLGVSTKKAETLSVDAETRFRFLGAPIGVGIHGDVKGLDEGSETSVCFGVTIEVMGFPVSFSPTAGKPECTTTETEEED